MKNLLILTGRTVVILLAALVVVGVTMRVVDTSATTRFPAEQRGEFAQVGDAAQRTSGVAQGAVAQSGTAGQPRPGERHGPRNQTLGGRLAFGIFGLGKNFAIIGVVVLMVVSIERFFIRRPHRVAA